MLISVGEPIVAFERVVRADGSVVRRGPHASGAPAIFSYVAASLGTPTAFIGGVGEDEHGRFFSAELARSGADAAAVHTDTNAPTATVLIHYDPDGCRSFDFSLADSAAARLPEAALRDYPERATWFHCSGSALQVGASLAATTMAALRRAKAAGARISLDPNIREELLTPGGVGLLREFAAASDVVFPSEGELAVLGLTGEALEDRGALVVQTMATEGAVARLGDQAWRQPALAHPASVVDTDGAGDTFAGAFVAAAMAGFDPGACLLAASQVVARAIAVEGPTTVDLSDWDWDSLAAG
ncbi:MAG: PfkB family carbohydrate kinase [Bifidobacteriaceae bacterium]|jgi:sugar/nucleoside kinase (ribokinase family)|nr:PfkB family carbohydrate kinase [Bifidobacteriaceae bacterium]